MSESPVELARVRDDSCCRVEDTLQLVGRLSRSANQETAAIINSARDERMNECSDRENVGWSSSPMAARPVTEDNDDELLCEESLTRYNRTW